MNPHPMIHSELARQREHDLRGSAASSRRSSTAGITPVVNAAIEGDQAAWEHLVERFTPTLRGIVRTYRLSAADADDVVQTAWESALVNIDRLREPEAIGGWLAVIARREALRTIELRRREVVVDDECIPEEQDHPDHDRALLEAERREAMQAAFERLSDHHRRLLGLLFRDSSMSYADISHRLEIPVGSIGPTRERALARLRRDRKLAALG